MLIRASRFNIYFTLILALLVTCGCQTPEKKLKKKLSLFRVHIEAPSKVPGRTREVTVFRQAPMNVEAEPVPFLTEEHVRNATVVETLGGFALQIEVNRFGRHLLEQYTSGNKTRRLLIFSHFADPNDPKKELNRWLAAPRISNAIVNGMLVFTPDATREEAEQIAQGLRNVAKKTGEAKEKD